MKQRGRDVEGLGDPADVIDGDILLSILNLAHVGEVKTDRRRKLFLSDADLLTEDPHVAGQLETIRMG